MAVTRRRAKPPHRHPELVNELVNALQNPKKAGASVPVVIEEEQRFGNTLHVTVIWDKWEDVSHEERGPIILEAYQRHRGDLFMLNITVAIGVTTAEAKRLNIK